MTIHQYGISMWVVPMREHNEDPVSRSLVSPNGSVGWILCRQTALLLVR